MVDRSAFAGMFDDHAAHLYDYCLALLADEAEAASAAKVTLIAAYKLGGRMTEPGQLRAWMFALGRRECRSESPIRQEPWVAPRKRSPIAQNGSEGLPPADAETREFARIDTADPLRTGFEAEIRRVVRMAPLTEKVYPPPPDCYTEVHDLVQRHRIAPAELPAILDVSAGEVEDLLAAVPAMVLADRRDHPGPLASTRGRMKPRSRRRRARSPRPPSRLIRHDRPHAAESAALGHVDLPDGANLGADSPDADAPSEADNADEGPDVESASDQVGASKSPSPSPTSPSPTSPSPTPTPSPTSPSPSPSQSLPANEGVSPSPTSSPSPSDPSPSDPQPSPSG